MNLNYKSLNIDRTCAILDMNVIKSNISQIKKMITTNTKIMAVVKADGYGHGAFCTAKAAIEGGASHLGVATASEALYLRENGIDHPILNFGYSNEKNIVQMTRQNIIQSVYSYECACLISKKAVELNKTAEIHIKIDTGMGRVGFPANELALVSITKIKELPNLRISGIYSHFADSDNSDQSFTHGQFDKFVKSVEYLKELRVEFETRHISNSGAILNFREFDLDMVRAGIITYGLPPSNNTDISVFGLNPALSWVAKINFVKDIGENVSIGYGRKFLSKKPTKVATVTLGYADGYSRQNSNRGIVIVKGKKAPVIGSVCMDQMMIDVTGISDVSPGDFAVILGQTDGESISAARIADIQGTIAYEIVTSIGKRVERHVIELY